MRYLSCLESSLWKDNLEKQILFLMSFMFWEGMNHQWLNLKGTSFKPKWRFCLETTCFIDKWFTSWWIKCEREFDNEGLKLLRLFLTQESGMLARNVNYSATVSQNGDEQFYTKVLLSVFPYQTSSEQWVASIFPVQWGFCINLLQNTFHFDYPLVLTHNTDSSQWQPPIDKLY